MIRESSNTFRIKNQRYKLKETIPCRECPLWSQASDLPDAEQYCDLPKKMWCEAVKKIYVFDGFVEEEK